MTAINRPYCSSKLRALAALAVAALFAKVLISMVWEYRWYFPADFENASFLVGRRDSFVGAYRAAFYAHIISGPMAIALGTFLMISGRRPRYRQLHRPLGKLQILNVLVVIVPSGLVMAQQAFAGPIAVVGFSALAVATGGSAIAAVYCAMKRQLTSHERWATRCFILLVSPLLLRLVTGAVIVTQLESDLTYQLNAWLSWIVPLMTYEIWWRCQARANCVSARLFHRTVPVEALP